jgi:ribosomal protein S18 acetylase RimI-like enzyme
VTLVVRTARPTDTRAVAEVQVRSWRAAYAGLMPAALLDGLSVDSRAEMWSRLVARSEHHLLVLTAPDVVGFASVGPDRQDPGFGQLYALYLDPAWWGRGAGRLLHDAAVAHLDARHAASRLWVLSTNQRAIRFYRAAGWRPDGTVQTEEQPGGHVLVEDRYVRSRQESRASFIPTCEGTNPSRS